MNYTHERDIPTNPFSQEVPMHPDMNEILNPSAASHDPAFRHAPSGWSRDEAIRVAQADGLRLTDDHWEVVRALQEYYARHPDSRVNLRELHDALDEKFHRQGGRKYLFGLLPGGPVAQGCRLAGLQPPAGAVQSGFGSVA
ncbi:sulfur relay protein, TusE/DsrC/DsvC family [Thioalkalivibrio sulfidiphilus HL-EbGr7]|uniref:Sulfur relay protein, TusE/DsrC/DsvC family n=2 Tax=Thioalkalivibrio TaxID=106633 RepID=B8GV14_THISH|nr:sulfur relay protein, TusE/DsrC/DsvC family [Thioalkalivibrio sulfidiphilus HL-EbGr7]